MEQLLAQSNLDPDLAKATLESLVQNGRVVAAGEGKNALLFTDTAWKQLVENILATVRDYHRKFPLRLGIPKAEISSKVKLGSHFPDIIKKLINQGLLSEEFALVRLPSHQIKLSSDQQSRMMAYLRQLDQNPYSPAPDVVLEPDLMNLLIDRGQVVRTAAGVVFSTRAYEDMIAKILDHLKKNGKITLGETRDMFQNSRKYAQALLEHLDEKKITKRVGDDRVLGTNA
jgi:selenocysteine-specific elongation factor